MFLKKVDTFTFLVHPLPPPPHQQMKVFQNGEDMNSPWTMHVIYFRKAHSVRTSKAMFPHKRAVFHCPSL